VAINKRVALLVPLLTAPAALKQRHCHKQCRNWAD